MDSNSIYGGGGGGGVNIDHWITLVGQIGFKMSLKLVMVIVLHGKNEE